MCKINIFERTDKFIPMHIGINMLQSRKTIEKLFIKYTSIERDISTIDEYALMRNLV